MYIAWLGDSRAYAFTPSQGIKRLSKDHSYVQQLVDAGNLSDIEAMNHPNSNVITRSLGDTAQKAKADVEEYRLEDGEIILLCSDGLCSVCTDDEIASVLTEEANDLQVCKELLTELALDNGGSDNITIALMQIVLEEEKGEDGKIKHRKSSKTILATLLILIGILAIGFFGWWMKSKTTVSIPVKEVKVEKPKNKSLRQVPATKRSKRQSKENKIEKSNITKEQKTFMRSKKDSLNNHKEVKPPTFNGSPGPNTGKPQPVIE